MKTRRATEADVPQLIEMGERFLTNPDYAGVIAFNPGQIDTVLRQLGSSPDSLLLVAEEDGRLFGMIGFVVYPHPFSGELVGGEVFWWSERPGAGRRLLDGAEAWAESKGAIILQMIAPNARVGRLYKARGYQPVETNWQRRLHGSRDDDVDSGGHLGRDGNDERGRQRESVE